MKKRGKLLKVDFLEQKEKNENRGNLGRWCVKGGPDVFVLTYLGTRNAIKRIRENISVFGFMHSHYQSMKTQGLFKALSKSLCVFPHTLDR